MKKIIITLTLFVSTVLLSACTNSTPTMEVKTYENIKTENKGAYEVKNVVYTGTSLEIATLEKVLKEIKNNCSKDCKINLYKDRKAYDIDINYESRTDEERAYLADNLIAYWGIDEQIEYYPNK